MSIEAELIYPEIGRYVHKLLRYEGEELRDIMDAKVRSLLEEIARIVADEALDDFHAMEELVLLLNKAGIDTGVRHDFG